MYFQWYELSFKSNCFAVLRNMFEESKLVNQKQFKALFQKCRPISGMSRDSNGLHWLAKAEGYFCQLHL